MGNVSNEFAKPLGDVTVILLGTGRTDYLGRAKNYYRRKVPHLQVVTVEADAQGISSHVDARQVAQTQAWKRAIGDCLECIETPYVVLVPETDFLLVDSLGESVEFLHANPQYALCQGFSLGYRPLNASVGYHKLGNALEHGDEPATSLERIRRHTASRLQAWRAVVRVDALSTVVRDAPEDLALESWKSALSFGLLAEHPVAILPSTFVLIEQSSADDAEDGADTGLAPFIEALRKWDAQTWQFCQRLVDQQALGDFARSMAEPGEHPLLFTSNWTQAGQKPERVFEPRQFIDLPYYSASLFNTLTELEFLVHAQPAGVVQIGALEGCWVRQQALLEVHPNDTPGSLQYRYAEAFSLGLFNARVSERLMGVLEDEEDRPFKEQVGSWYQRLQVSDASNVERLLECTPSGRILQALEQATPQGLARERVLRHLDKNPAPVLNFLVIDLEEDDAALQRTFDSLLGSGLRTFKVVVLRAGDLPAITTIHDTVHFIRVAKGSLVARLNQVIGQLKSDWLMVLDVGDVLAPGGVLRLHVELSSASDYQAISANEIQRDQQGCLHSVVRPANNIELLRSRPDLMSRHWVLRRSAVQACGGFNEACQGAFEFDLLLRLIEQKGVSGFAHMDEYLVIAKQDDGAMAKDAYETLKRHLVVLGYRGQVNMLSGGGFHIDFRHSHTPMVSILLPAGSNCELLKSCLASITQRTRYQRYEIIVIGDSRTSETVREYLSRFEGASGRVKVLWSEQAHTRESLLSLASGTAQGEYLILLSDRSQIVTPAWIESLLNQAQRPEVGVVGCKMISEDNIISHAGFELNSSGRVLASWVGLARQALEPAVGVAIERGCHGVSSDCLMVRKSAFEQVQGLDTINDNQVAADIDFCLKVATLGLLTVWAPQAQVRNPGVEAGDLRGADMLFERWPGAFSTRAVVEGERGIDVSRAANGGQVSMLAWVDELGEVV
ncbi:glycosyltransferase [Pseudomonas sp. P66]|uniref:Glycosyltransferase n=1 Tax=Pseudomonas arcuscaelestis TaxID=2710591 RepID=A0ABS2C430_9PSED|nr:glycosyltransferase [Pseudomonas arcuscaelestis]MBM5460633.1 glycosyltransferase [Pseudomonas arcuscaelestis]